jgi:hypothetical protein
MNELGRGRIADGDVIERQKPIYIPPNGIPYASRVPRKRGISQPIIVAILSALVTFIGAIISVLLSTSSLVSVNKVKTSWEYIVIGLVIGIVILIAQVGISFLIRRNRKK